jgi:membrane associated rhomboid family serine protease
LLWLLVNAAGLNDRAAYLMGFIPARISGGLELSSAVPVLLTPLTATLVHSNLIHLAFNMLILVWCGTAVERILGRGGLVILYLVGAYASLAAQFAADMAGTAPWIGASGAVSAVVGAFSLSFGRPKQIVRSMRVNRWLNALWLLAAWVVIQVMMGIIAGGQGIVIGTAAHIGGFIAGLLLQRPLLMWRYRNA